MDLDKINQLASDAGLSSYEGEAGNAYTGYGDDFVDFGGKALDFSTEIATDRVFSITVVNASGAPVNILLTPSYSPSVAANVVRDGVIIAGVTGSGSPKTIAEFLAFISRNPTRVLAFKVVSNLSAQLATTMNIDRKSPFRNLETELINLASYTKEENQNDKMVTVRRGFQIDDQTEVNITIPDTATTTFTFYCGGVLNTAKALNAKSGRAGRHPSVANSRAMIAGR